MRFWNVLHGRLFLQEPHAHQGANKKLGNIRKVLLHATSHRRGSKIHAAVETLPGLLRHGNADVHGNASGVLELLPGTQDAEHGRTRGTLWAHHQVQTTVQVRFVASIRNFCCTSICLGRINNDTDCEHFDDDMRFDDARDWSVEKAAFTHEDSI